MHFYGEQSVISYRHHLETSLFLPTLHRDNLVIDVKAIIIVM